MILESDEQRRLELIATGVAIRYEGADKDMWQMGTDLTDDVPWKGSVNRYKAYWNEVWPGILGD